ncbi:MAG: hypothetical protein ABIU85_04015 [Methylotenera sp.]
MTLAISPALAANCALSCTSKIVMSALSPDDMSTMKNCHEASNDKSSTLKDSTRNHTNQSDANHQSCTMGAGCHFSQATPTDSSSKYAFIASTIISFPKFDSNEKSVDLSPPLKPPA